MAITERDAVTRAKGGSNTVGKALRVLGCFRSVQGDLGVTDIARMLDLPTTVVHRLLRSLLDSGFVEQDSMSSKYRLGTALSEYGQIVYRQHRMFVAEPLVDELAARTGCAVSIATRDRSDAVFVCFSRHYPVSGQNPNLGGVRVPLGALAMGWVLLAWAKPGDDWPGHEPEVGGVDSIRGRPQDTAVTNAQLAEIRQCGYAINDEDLRPNWRCIAVPIVSGDGSIRYSLGLGGTAAQLNRPKMLRLVPVVRQTADAIAAAIARGVADETDDSLPALRSS